MNELGMILAIIGTLIAFFSACLLYVGYATADYEFLSDNRLGLFIGLLVIAFGIWLIMTCSETEAERLARENKAMRVELLERRKPSDRMKYLQTLRKENERLKRKLKDP